MSDKPKKTITQPPKNTKAKKAKPQQPTSLTYRFMHDLVVKMVFSKNPHLLQDLVARLLKIDPNSIRAFHVTNTEILPEGLEEKFCRLDIMMTVDKRLVNLEVQVADKKDFVDRSTYYLAREYSSALPASGKYKDLPQTIVISIIDFIQFKSSPHEYYSEFRFLEIKRHEPLTDKLSMIYCELPKLPNIADTSKKLSVNNNDEILKLWLSLFKAKTETELTDIENLEVDVLSKAVAAYRSVTTSKEFKELERIRAKARHDEAQALSDAREERDEYWQGVVAQIAAEKDAAIAEQTTLIAKLQAMVNGDR